MKISKQVLARLADLSKLELSEEESEQLSGQLETIVNYMDILVQLSAPNPDCGEPPSRQHNIFREDRVIGSHDRAELLSNAPQTDGVTLTVPKTVE